MADPITIGALIGSGLSAAYKGYQGYKQQKDAKEAMKRLNEPTIEVPAAMRQMAQEPISERVMSAQAQEQARRTAQSVGALQKAGARGIMGGLGGVMDSERSFERNRMANYEQARNEAMGRLGAAEMDVQNRKMQNYLQKMGAAQRSLEAGQQNIAGVFDSVSNVGQQLLSAKLQGLIPETVPETNPKTTTFIPQISAPSIAEIPMEAPNMGGLRGIGTPSEYARALQILNRI